jgi:KAP family P-loop domain/Photosynthesis system II assembly factor YCF48
VALCRAGYLHRVNADSFYARTAGRFLRCRHAVLSRLVPSPIEKNAFKRLPAIGGTLKDVFVLPSAKGGNTLIWTVGSGGLILHSVDGGKTWVQQKNIQLITAQASSVGARPPASNLTPTPTPSPRANLPTTSPVPKIKQMQEQGPIQQSPEQRSPQEPNPIQQQAPEKRSLLDLIPSAWAGGRVKQTAPQQPIPNNSVYDAATTYKGQQTTPEARPPVMTKDETALQNLRPQKNVETTPNTVQENPSNLPNMEGKANLKQDIASPIVVPETTLPLYLIKIFFVDAITGWAVDTGGTILKTTDGGTRWEKQISGSEARLTAVHFIEGRTGWAVGYGGTILKTTDGGTRWEKQTSNTDISLQGISFDKYGSTGRAVGRGDIILTHDGGKTWQSVGYSKYPAPWFYAGLLLTGLLCVPAIRGAQQAKMPTIEIGAADIAASDAPLSDARSAKLDFKPIAVGLANFLRNTKTEPPLVVAITGGWGSGKSSIMGMLQKELEPFGIRSVWFNAWHHQTEEQLLASLLENVRKQAVPPIYWLSLKEKKLSGLMFRIDLARERLRRRWWKVALWVSLLVMSATYLFGDPDHWGQAWTTIEYGVTFFRDGKKPENLDADAGASVPGLLVVAGKLL